MVRFFSFNVAQVFRPVTYQDGGWRFEFLIKILKFAFFRVLRRGLDMGSYSYDDSGDELPITHKDLYYERLYDIQNGPENYLQQLVMAFWAIYDAYRLNRLYKPRTGAGNELVAFSGDEPLIGLRHVVEDGIAILSGAIGEIGPHREWYAIRHLGDLFYTMREGYSITQEDCLILDLHEVAAIVSYKEAAKFIDGEAPSHWREILPIARDTFNALKFDEDVSPDALARTRSLLQAFLAGIKRRERSMVPVSSR